MRRGQKSSSELAVSELIDSGVVDRAIHDTKRLACPLHLSDAERDVWMQCVNDQPAEAFTAVHIPQLEAYCRHVVQSRIIADQLLHFDSAWLADDDGLKRYGKLLDMHEKETRAIGAMARALRITRQSIDQQTIARMNVNASRKGNKPWQMPTD